MASTRYVLHTLSVDDRTTFAFAMAQARMLRIEADALERFARDNVHRVAPAAAAQPVHVDDATGEVFVMLDTPDLTVNEPDTAPDSTQPESEPPAPLEPLTFPLAIEA